MTDMFAMAALWLSLAVLATIIAGQLRLSIALVEICLGVIAGAIAERYLASPLPGANQEWLRFLSATGATALTFLAGAELEPAVLRRKWREVTVVGAIGFFAPFLGCAAVAYYALGWDARASWLCGIALSTTSMAVVYAVMLESGFNVTDFGKGILGACFINDLGTVLALGFIFAPFTYKTGVFASATLAVLTTMPLLLRWLTARYGNRTAAIRTKVVLAMLFGLGALASWAESEPVLPAYIAGMILAEIAAQDHHWVRRLRTLTVGLLTPFYFLRAGSLVSLPTLASFAIAVVSLLAGKVTCKIFGLYPVIARFRRERRERWYYTLLMSTGLTFGTISALYGFSHNIITRCLLYTSPSPRDS